MTPSPLSLAPADAPNVAGRALFGIRAGGEDSHGDSVRPSEVEDSRLRLAWLVWLPTTLFLVSGGLLRRFGSSCHGEVRPPRPGELALPLGGSWQTESAPYEDGATLFREDGGRLLELCVGEMGLVGLAERCGVDVDGEELEGGGNKAAPLDWLAWNDGLGEL